MRTVRSKASAGIALLGIAFFIYGCGDDGSPSGPVEEAYFRDLTLPENLVYNLVLSYQKLDINEYSRLLLSNADGDYGQEYYWFNQDGDVGILGEAFYARDEDISRTNNLFQAAKGTPTKPEHPVIDKLMLDIDPGAWVQVDSLWGEPCEDCWQTERNYYVSIRIGEDAPYADDKVVFYVVPVQVGGVTEYRIALAVDSEI